MWNCICNCGESIVRDSKMVKQDKKCRKCVYESQIKEKANVVCLANYRLKTIWSRMKDRCYNSKHISFKYYGELGITICDSWKNDFITFKTWSLENGYQDHLTLDRKNTFGNYEPDNCRWITKKAQQANRKDSVKIEFNGELLNAGQIADITGNSYANEYQKIRRLNKKST